MIIIKEGHMQYLSAGFVQGERLAKDFLAVWTPATTVDSHDSLISCSLLANADAVDDK